MRAIILSVFAVVIVAVICPKGASATMTFYQDPTTWSFASGFSGDLNGGQTGWLSQVGSAAQPFDGTAVRIDNHWQCETDMCGPFTSWDSTTVLSGLTSFSIKFDSSAGNFSCLNSALGAPGCSGINFTTFHLGGAITALGAMVRVLGLNFPLSFDDFTFNGGFPVGYYGDTFETSRAAPLTIFLGVVSDQPFESFTISTSTSPLDEDVGVAFSDILVAPVDEPSTFFLGLPVLVFVAFWTERRHRADG